MSDIEYDYKIQAFDTNELDVQISKIEEEHLTARNRDNNASLDARHRSDIEEHRTGLRCAFVAAILLCVCICATVCYCSNPLS